MYQLGVMHATGVGTSRNCELAVGLFKNVAERGSWSKLYCSSTFLPKYCAWSDSTCVAVVLFLCGLLGSLKLGHPCRFSIAYDAYDEDGDVATAALIYMFLGELGCVYPCAVLMFDCLVDSAFCALACVLLKLCREMRTASSPHDHV